MKWVLILLGCATNCGPTLSTEQWLQQLAQVGGIFETFADCQKAAMSTPQVGRSPDGHSMGANLCREVKP